MNISPNTLQSIVTKNKDLVEVGTHLYTCGSEFVTVIERDGDMILVNAEDDTAHEWDNWYDLNSLQTTWTFARSDNWKNDFGTTLNSDSLFASKEEIEVNAALNASQDPTALKLSNLINFTSKQVMSDYDTMQYVYFAKGLGMSDKAQAYIMSVLFSKYIPGYVK